MLRRSLKVLNGLLKEFASLKMPAGMKVMATVSITIVILINFQWLSDRRTTSTRVIWLLFYDGC